jgi:hypothetical protein
MLRLRSGKGIRAEIEERWGLRRKRVEYQVGENGEGR